MQIIVCDTDAQSLHRTKKLLESCAQKQGETINIQSFDSLKKLFFVFEDIGNQVDLIYIEVDAMGAMSGGEFAQKISSFDCTAEVVFLAHEEQRWPEGYDAGAFHFLIKEYNNQEKFEEVFQKVSYKIQQKTKKVIAFSYAGEKIVVPVSEIRYFKSQGRMVRVFYQEDKEFEFYSRMSKIENTLLNEGFIRIHKSYLINRSYLADVKSTVITLSDGTELPLSRTAAPLLKEVKLAKPILKV